MKPQLNLSKSKHKYNRNREITQQIENITKREIDETISYYEQETNDEQFETREKLIREQLSKSNRFTYDDITDVY